MSLSALEVDRPELLDVPAYEVEHLVILDHDRTRGPVEAAMGRLLTVAALYGIDTDRIAEEQKLVEADGMSFDPLTTIKAQLTGSSDPQATSDTFTAFKHDFTTWQESDGRLLYPDAVRLEARLNATPTTPHLVMTAGKNVEWQGMKVSPDFDGYVTIIPVAPHEKTPPKGPVIAEWQDPETGRYHVVGLDADGIAQAMYSIARPYLVDDKAVSLKGMPEGGEGALLVRPEEGKLASQGSTADLPSDRKIDVIASLDEIDLPRDYTPAADPEIVSRICKFVPLAEYVKLY